MLQMRDGNFCEVKVAGPFDTREEAKARPAPPRSAAANMAHAPWVSGRKRPRGPPAGRDRRRHRSPSHWTTVAAAGRHKCHESGEHPGSTSVARLSPVPHRPWTRAASSAPEGSSTAPIPARCPMAFAGHARLGPLDLSLDTPPRRQDAPSGQGRPRSVPAPSHSGQEAVEAPEVRPVDLVMRRGRRPGLDAIAAMAPATTRTLNPRCAPLRAVVSQHICVMMPERATCSTSEDPLSSAPTNAPPVRLLTMVAASPSREGVAHHIEQELLQLDDCRPHTVPGLPPAVRVKGGVARRTNRESFFVALHSSIEQAASASNPGCWPPRRTGARAHRTRQAESGLRTRSRPPPESPRWWPRRAIAAGGSLARPDFHMEPHGG